MKLDKTEFKYLENVVKTAKVAGIDQVILEQGKVRGITEDKTIVMMHTDDVPEFKFGSMGIGRVSTFLDRYSLFNAGEVGIELSLDENHPFVRSCVFSAQKLTVGYRFANPQTIRAPKEIKDTIIKSHIPSIGESSVSQVSRGMKAMGADTMRIVADNGTISIQIADVNQDMFVFDVASKLTDHEGNPCEFSHKYPKVVVEMLAANPSTDLKISTKGIIFIQVNGLTLAMLPIAEAMTT